MPKVAVHARPDDLFGTRFSCRNQQRPSSILKAILTLLVNNGGANRKGLGLISLSRAIQNLPDDIFHPHRLQIQRNVFHE